MRDSWLKGVHSLQIKKENVCICHQRSWVYDAAATSTISAVEIQRGKTNLCYVAYNNANWMKRSSCMHTYVCRMASMVVCAVHVVSLGAIQMTK